VGTSMIVRIVAALLLVAPWLVQAAGLGELHLTSKLGQPLKGEIPVVSVKQGEELLSARIASHEAYENAGLRRIAAVAGARVSIVTVKGQPVILIKGVESVNEPAIDLLVELRWTSGQVMRAYRILLDRPKV
jgi:pilus assembly protein FimV